VKKGRIRILEKKEFVIRADPELCFLQQREKYAGYEEQRIEMEQINRL